MPAGTGAGNALFNTRADDWIKEHLSNFSTDVRAQLHGYNFERKVFNVQVYREPNNC